jgi:hypothetical protein
MSTWERTRKPWKSAKKLHQSDDDVAEQHLDALFLKRALPAEASKAGNRVLIGGYTGQTDPSQRPIRSQRRPALAGEGTSLSGPKVTSAPRAL